MKTCKTCNEKEVEPNRTYCSRACANRDPEKIVERNRKLEQTNLKKYGVRRPIQNKEINSKRIQTSLERFGTVSPLQTTAGRKHWESVIRERFGVSNPSQDRNVQEKLEQTNLKKYGVRRPIQNTEIANKMRETMQELYNVSHASHSPTINEKRRQTNKKRYGSEFHVQQHNIPAFDRLENYEWLCDEYETQQKSAKQISQELGVSLQTVCNYLHAHDIPIKQFQRFSLKALQWIKHIEENENVVIRHAQTPGGEFRIPGTRYHVDGFCEQTNTVYEFLGDRWHGNLRIFDREEYCHPYSVEASAFELNKKTFRRLQEISEQGFTVCYVWENDWDNKDALNTFPKITLEQAVKDEID